MEANGGFYKTGTFVMKELTHFMQKILSFSKLPNLLQHLQVLIEINWKMGMKWVKQHAQKMKFSIKDCFRDTVNGYIYREDNLHAFTEEILNGKPNFLCSASLNELINF